MPFKDKAALTIWREKNRDKIRAKDRRAQKRFWTKHERPKLPPFDLVENRRRIKELKALGIHLTIETNSKDYSVSPTLLQDGKACIDCGETKRLVVLDTVTVQFPRIILRFPYLPLDEKYVSAGLEGREIVIQNASKHCQHFKFEDLEVAKQLAYGFRFQCDCDFRRKRRLTFDSYQMEVAFCYDCLTLHLEDYNFDLCQRSIPKLLKALQKRKTGVLRPRLRSVFPDKTPQYDSGYYVPQDTPYAGYCRLCLASIAQVAFAIKAERLAPEREAYGFLDLRHALEQTAFLDDMTLTPYQIAEKLKDVDLNPIPKLAQVERELYSETST